MQRKRSIEGTDPLLLFGFNDTFLRKIEAAFPEVQITARGHQILLDGQPETVDDVEDVLDELERVLRRNGTLTERDVETVLALSASGDGAPTLEHVPDDVVLFTASGGAIKPKTPNQARLVESARHNDIVFAIGPAGTGKTYVAMALAVAALKSRQVKRLVLTRPAVEAGEQLGFLPGDLREKIDPYLRPLYDALEDMLSPGKLETHLEQGIIEIVPLAYMRGRAQPLTSNVLTPEGFKPMRALHVGDYVIGSDGQPTRVEGIYPQGEKEVFEVIMSDGSRTRCCGEHLWTVFTRSGRRRGTGPRTLQTQEMIGNLRAAHYHRYELPLLSESVDFPEQDVVIDPYALGLLLGDGCLTGSSSPSFTTGDPALAAALEKRLQGIKVKYKDRYDYVLSKPSHQPQFAPNPLTDALRELDLRGTYSSTKFVPPCYLYNSAAIRLAVLQGLLDTDGGPVTQKNRTCRVQYSTTSAQLRDDVLFLVRSLGGVAYWRTRTAEGRSPGHANGRDVSHRNDAFILDIRLPEGVRPFRLKRKAALYAEDGGGRPMRFITRIESVGREPTQCIRVAAEDALYVTDDFILTHNTLRSAFVILDEAQNATRPQMKMFLTRLGPHSRAIVTGDVTQTDLPSRDKSGLVQAEHLLRAIGGIDFVYFDEHDVVRHRLVKQIIRAYEHFEKEHFEKGREGVSEKGRKGEWESG